MSQPTSALGRLLDVKDAAAYLDLTADQLRRHIAARRVRVFRAGRKVQIYERWLDEFRAAFTCEPTNDARGVVPAEPITHSPIPTGIRDLMPAKRQIVVCRPGRRRRRVPAQQQSA